MSKPTEKFILVSPTAYGATGEFALTYRTQDDLAAGQFVTVPLGRRTSLGAVIGKVPAPEFKTKDITEVLELPPLPRPLVELAAWLHEYYLTSAKAVWQTLLPAGLTKQRRAARSTAAKPFELPGPDKALTGEQEAAIHAIEQGRHHSYILHGVTGSGKTQVYIELAARALARGLSVIVLVPEIALTNQLIARFAGRFGDTIIPYHSQLSERERHLAWQAAWTSPGPRIVIGARSALFLPLARLGLIVIDEAHDTSYKQEQSPRYHAPIVAGKLAHLTEARLVVGSATPPLTDLYLAKQGRLGYVAMRQRINRRPNPQPIVVDRRDKANFSRSQFLSNPLVDAMSETLAAQRQSLLFINRRGSASSLICTDCGEVINCPNCHLPLTFHADLARLVCHYCNLRQVPPAVCPHCGQANLRYLGGGTKRIESEARRLFPAARLARLDRDSQADHDLGELHRRLHSGEIDIIIGTQMVAKGWDLPQLDTVGIVAADSLLHLPDYMAGERTYQLITQVSGRTGRTDQPGRVIIQSYTPNHPAIAAAAQNDFGRWAAAELAERRLLAYPPYVFLLKLTYSRKDTGQAQAGAEQLAERLHSEHELTVLGPAPAFREHAAGKSHWQLIVKAARRARLIQAAGLVPTDWTIDLDPINLL
jgi:primosomal protein N' (replication factor Y) (superfamily II helicase)